METNPTPSSPPSPPVSSGDDKTVAIVSYLTIVGFIVAIVLHNSKKTKLGAYHLRQALGLVVSAIVLFFASFIIAWIPVVNLLMVLVWPVVGIGLLVFWIFGLIAAINGELKPMPLVGPLFEKWFGSAFE
jgi:uncharacterized membrane protein